MMTEISKNTHKSIPLLREPTDPMFKTVYPGHPCLIAMQAMANFDDHKAMTKHTKDNWPEALSCSNIRGSGGAVYQGLVVIDKIMEGHDAIEAAFDLGCTFWKRSRKSDFNHVLEEGNKAADDYREDFIEQASAWLSRQQNEDASAS